MALITFTVLCNHHCLGQFSQLRVLWTARTSNQSILKEVNPAYSLEELMLKLKLQYFGHLMRRIDSLGKILMLGKIEGGRRRGWQRMRWLNGITDLITTWSWTWVWASSGRWWRTGKPGMLQSMGLQRVGPNWVTEQQQLQILTQRWIMGAIEPAHHLPRIANIFQRKTSLTRIGCLQFKYCPTENKHTALAWSKSKMPTHLCPAQREGGPVFQKTDGQLRARSQALWCTCAGFQFHFMGRRLLGYPLLQETGRDIFLLIYIRWCSLNKTWGSCLGKGTA